MPMLSAITPVWHRGPGRDIYHSPWVQGVTLLALSLWLTWHHHIHPARQQKHQPHMEVGWRGRHCQPLTVHTIGMYDGHGRGLKESAIFGVFFFKQKAKSCSIACF